MKYRLTVIISPEFDGTDAAKVKDLVATFVGAAGTVTDVTLQGKKTFAYPIQKKSEGFYAEATVEANALHVSDLQKKIEPGAMILRFLLAVT